jgi:uncharacterized protein (TIGR03067 family)
MKLRLKALSAIATGCLLLAAGAATGGDDKSDGAKGELARLKGTWVGELNGKTYIINFNGEKFATIFEFAEGTTTASGTITVDPTQAPRHMDWAFAEATGRAEKMKGKTAQTIYSLDGDTFKFLACREGKRPEKFPEKEDVGDCIYLVFKRVK